MSETIIPSNEPYEMGKLDNPWRNKLNNDLRLAIAKVLHEADFDPSVYLGK